jgi:hypothetical protein
MARRGRKKVNVGLILIALAAIVLVAGVAYWLMNKSISETKANEQTGCLENAPAPEAALFMVDTTDRLTKETAERIKTHITDNVNSLERYSRVLIVAFGGDTAEPLKTIFDHCVPGKAREARLYEGSRILEQKYAEFQTDLSNFTDTLHRIPDSKTSPITAQVIRAAGDPTLHWEGKARRLVLITDGLQSSIYWTKNLKLPDPDPDILKGIKVEYFEIGNVKSGHLQTPKLRSEWKAWLEHTGADVRITAPGYPASS